MYWPSLALAAYGLLAMTAQAVLLRELGSLTRGNEVVIGMLLFAWLAGNGLGSGLYQFLPRRIREWPGLAGFLLFSSATLLTGTVFLVRVVQGMLLYESAPNLVWVTAASLVLILPVGVPAGITFSRLAAVRRKRSALATAYLLESSGAFLGGMLFAFGFAGNLDMLRVAALLATGFGVAFLAGPKGPRVFSLAAAALAALAASAAFRGDAAHLSRLLQFHKASLVSVAESRLADVAVTRSQGLMSVYYGGRVLYSEDSLAWEEAWLLPALAGGRPRRVLVAGFPPPPLVDGLARLSPDEVRAVFADRALAGLLEERVAEGKISVEIADPFSWGRRPRGRFDLILVPAELPRAISDNRFFSETFYRRLRAMLAEDGILSLSVPYEDPLPSPATLERLETIMATLSACFPRVGFLAAEKFHFFAGSGEMPLEEAAVARKLGGLGVGTLFVNEGYIRHYFAKERREAFRNMLSAGQAGPNGLFSMGLYRACLRQWLRTDLGDGWILGLAAALLGLFLAAGLWRGFRADGHSAFLLAAGFGLMTAEIELMNFHQGASGWIFRSYAYLASLFMLGAAGGAAWALLAGREWGARGAFTALASVWIGTVAILYLLPSAAAAEVGESLPLMGGLNLLGGMGAGGIFGAEAARLSAKGRETGRACAQLYSFDLFGAAAASLLAPLAIVPLLGHAYAAGLGLAVLLAAAAITRGRRHGL